MPATVRELDMVGIADGKWGPIPKLGPRIPFGYAQDPNNEKQFVPVAFEMEALDKAKQYLRDGHSLRSVSKWLTDKTGRYISHEGLKRRVMHDETDEHRTRVIRRWSEALAEAVKEVKEFDLRYGKGTEWYDEFVGKLLAETSGKAEKD